MKSNVKPIPYGFSTVTPYLTVRNAAKAIEFYQRAFGAHERYRMAMPDGKVAHAELKIGNSIIMLGDESPDLGNLSPDTLNGSTGGLALYLENVDEVFQRAVQAGAKPRPAAQVVARLTGASANALYRALTEPE